MTYSPPQAWHYLRKQRQRRAGLNKGVGVGASPLPLNSRVVQFGDSITNQGNDTESGWSTTPPSRGTWGYTTWADVLSGCKLYEPPGGNLGIDGNTTTQMASRLSSIGALSPKLVRVLGGINDVRASASAATIIANLETIYGYIRSIGARISAVQMPPCFSPAALTGPQETVRQTVNAWIAQQAAADLVVTDSSSMTSGDFLDGLHPNVAGAYKLGGLVAASEAKLLSSASFADDFFVGALLTLNPTLSGTGGSNFGGPVSGTLATSFGVFADTTTATFALSKDGSDRQLVSFGGTSDDFALYLSQTITPASPVGKSYEAVAEVEIMSALSGIASISSSIHAWNNSDVELASKMMLAPSDEAAAAALVSGRTYVLRTPALTVPSGTTKLLVLVDAITRGIGAGAMAGQIKVRRMGMREVPA